MKEQFKERFSLIRPLLVPVILYIGLMAMATSFKTNFPSSPWRLPILLVPMVPGLFLVVGVIKAISRLDEMNRKIILESSVVSFAVTLIVSIPFGLIEIAEKVQFNALYIGLFMVVTWLGAKIIITRRYQ